MLKFNFAVLVYEVNVSSREYNTPLAVADLTIVGGALLPTRSIHAESNARALLVDVRNGYPYGTAVAELDVKKYSTSWGSHALKKKISHETKVDIFEKLIPEIEKVFSGLLKESK